MFHGSKIKPQSNINTVNVYRKNTLSTLQHHRHETAVKTEAELKPLPDNHISHLLSIVSKSGPQSPFSGGCPTSVH